MATGASGEEPFNVLYDFIGGDIWPIYTSFRVIIVLIVTKFTLCAMKLSNSCYLAVLTLNLATFGLSYFIRHSLAVNIEDYVMPT